MSGTIPMTPLTFAGPGPHGGLQPCQHLLEEQHSMEQAVQRFSGVHRQQLHYTNYQGVVERKTFCWISYLQIRKN